MTGRSEEQLFERARAGDRSAFGRLQQALEGRVRRFIVRLIGQNELVDDVAQDAFLALYVKLERIAGFQHVLPFLFRVVRHRCYDELRRQGRYEVVSLEGVLESSDPSVQFGFGRRSSTDDVVHWALIASEVQNAIDRLPEVQRQVLILYCEEELTYAEIAEVMGTDMGTVKSRIHYGRKNLRQLIRPELLDALKTNKEDTDG